MRRRLFGSFHRAAALMLSISLDMSLQGCGYLIDMRDDAEYIYEEDVDDSDNSEDEVYYSARTDEDRDSWLEKWESWENWDDDEFNVWDEDDYYDEDEYAEEIEDGDLADEEDSDSDDEECHEAYESTGGTGVFTGDNGSGNTLTGNIPVISLYVDDANYSWTDSQEDSRTFAHTVRYLDIACRFLMDEASKWGQELNLIYDFYEDEDLGYFFSIESDSVKDYYNANCEIWYFIENNIDVGALQERYNADSVAIMVYINTDKSIKEVSCTTCFYAGYALDSVYEFSYMFMHSNEEEETPAAFAHEMMHQFSAIDLYLEDEKIGLSEEEIEKLESDYPNDIMYTTYEAITWIPVYSAITNEISELDAYYIGWTDHSDLVDEYELMSR